mgnify:CR=1 FL=1
MTRLAASLLVLLCAAVTSQALAQSSSANRRPGFGIAEWRDDYPGGKKVVMNPPIGWGEYAEIGGDYINYPKMSPFQSWPPAMAQGVQCVAYEALMSNWSNTVSSYKDVLQFTYLQSWSGKPGAGARYWMAKGVGPVAVQWIAPSPITGQPVVTARLDAIVTYENRLLS